MLPALKREKSVVAIRLGNAQTSIELDIFVELFAFP